MADTNYSRTNITTADPEVAEHWGERLYYEALAATAIYPYIGEGDDNIVQKHNEMEEAAGDKVTLILRMQLTGDGRTEGEDLAGNEESLTTHTDAMLINELYHGVRSASKISEQRTVVDCREEAHSALRDWWAGRIDECAANHLTGTDVSEPKREGFNTITAPSANRWVFEGGAANEAALTSNTFNLTFSTIDKAVSIAETSSPLIRPIMVNGEPHYIFFAHPWQYRDLTANANPGEWLDFHKMGGPRAYSENSLFTGALGMYKGVVLKKWSRLPVGGTANTRRAVLCGAQALHLAYGQEAAGGVIDWVEEPFDYKRKLGVGAGMVFGIKKAVFNSEDFGTVVASTYASADGN